MARPLKIFTIEGCYSHLPAELLGLLGAPKHITQGDIYVLAITKKDAAERLSKAAGGTVRPGHIHETAGNDIMAVVDGTSFLRDEGDIVAMWGRGSKNVAVSRGSQWFLVGETTHKDPANPRNWLNKPIFVPVEPKPEPVRLVIELDADMDRELIEKLLVPGARCAVAFGRIDRHEVVGKVIEP